MEANVLALDSFGYSGEEEKGFQCGRFSKYIPKGVNSDAVDVSMIVTVSCFKKLQFSRAERGEQNIPSFIWSMGSF